MVKTGTIILSKKLYNLFLACFFLLINISASLAQTYSFTTAGASGRTGPTQTQLNNVYNSTSLAGAVTASNGIQQWTVPTTGPYSIELAGAEGGSASNNSSVGGYGARGKTQVNLTQGQVLLIVVGQKGGNGTSNWA